MPENVVLTLNREDLTQAVQIFFDASETLRDEDNNIVKGRTITEEKIEQAVDMALQLGWGSWSTAKGITINGERLS
eukprot:CAMPEP_0196594580 /NCGR_PEP_ID=MMETSP1081-20130531/78729_1 /TAXON_ID=36882 /ORGANISM="Pyramimonas amylifera, Strain CCMP720" /LENGTH=75 /DNA_ID=CAMNT_0041918877 /DNA_START=340 /DNA_END=567 /DNA_ORIENTATION=+